MRRQQVSLFQRSLIGASHDLPEVWREDALPALISLDKGNNISAFEVVIGRAVPWASVARL